MKRKVKMYIGDIIENMTLALKITNESDFNRFTEEKPSHYAVIRCIEVIGEAVKHVPDDVRTEHPQIPWRQMAGMRDTLIHFYMGVDLEIVWRTVVEQFPGLIPIFEQIYNELTD